MTALPSFVELMASLGIDNGSEGKGPQTTPLSHHSRSSSYSSQSSVGSHSSGVSSSKTGLYSETCPTIYISRHRNSFTSSDRDGEGDVRRHKARFSPYTPSISHVRRGSMPHASSDEERPPHPSRAYSTSPSPLMKPRTVGRRQSALGLKRPEKLALGEPELMGNTPISTYVRRKTPQASPISPTFPHRSRRATSPVAPVSIPKLPTFIFPAPSESTAVSSDNEDDDMGLNTDPSIRSLSVREVYAAGALQSMRHSESNIHLRSSPALESRRSTSIPPVA